MNPRWLVCSLLALSTGCASLPPGPARFETTPCPPPAADSATVIKGFYEAFSRRDFLGMACAYDPQIEFTDSIFGTLRGKRALAMWAMLTSQSTDLTIQFSRVHADGASGGAHWDAEYTFPFLAFDNHVLNRIDASFELRDGKIVRHRDVFDLPKWMSMALWPLGGVVSEDTIKEAVQKKLAEFIAVHPEFQDAPASPQAPPVPATTPESAGRVTNGS